MEQREAAGPCKGGYESIEYGVLSIGGETGAQRGQQGETGSLLGACDQSILSGSRFPIELMYRSGSRDGRAWRSEPAVVSSCCQPPTAYRFHLAGLPRQVGACGPRAQGFGEDDRAGHPYLSRLSREGRVGMVTYWQRAASRHLIGSGRGIISGLRFPFE